MMHGEGAGTWYGKVNQDGSFSVLARVTSLAGSGVQVVPREGNCLQQTDVAAISCRIWDLGINKDTFPGVEVTPGPTVTVASSVFDVLQTNGWPTDLDAAGYNFRCDLAGSFFDKAGTGAVGEWYLLVFQFTLVSGGTFPLRIKVATSPVPGV